jgi:mRNA interferase RelE/StbE
VGHCQVSLRVVVSKPARKALERIEIKQRAKITSALETFVQTGRGDIETVKPFLGEYRLRVGDWRVRFSLDAARGELVVLHVLNRREAYRD